MLGDVPLIKSNISRRSCYTRVENNIKQATKYRNGSDLWLDDKIVKVNKLYLNSLLVSIVNRVSQSGTMKYQCEWKHRCVKQEMVTYVAKGRQPFLFSEVIQRYSGSEIVICWLNSFQFRRTIRDWSHSCISPLTGIAPTQTFINFFFNNFIKIIFKQFF